MIIEVDDKTGKATTFKDLDTFCISHKTELEPIFEKKFKPEVEFSFWN